MIIIIPTLATLRIPLFNSLNIKLNDKLVVLVKDLETKDRERGAFEKCEFEWHLFSRDTLSKLAKSHEVIVVTNTRDAVTCFVYKIYGKKIVFWIGETETTYAVRTKSVQKKFLKYVTLKSIDAFACYSYESCNFLARKYGIAAHKLFHLPQSIDYDSFDSALKIHKEGILKFVVISRLTKMKYVSRLVTEFTTFQNKFPEVELDIYGEGEEKQILEEMTKATNFIQVKGFVPYAHVPETLKRYDVFIMQTLQDSWGLTVNEAIASRLAVIMSECAPAKELITHRKTGFIYNPTISEDYQSALSWIMENRNRLGSMSDENYRNLIASYHYVKSADAFCKIENYLKK